MPKLTEAEKAEKKRLADEAKAKAAEEDRLKAELQAKEEAEKKRLADEAEKKRLDDEAEKKRLDDEEAARSQREQEEENRLKAGLQTAKYEDGKPYKPGKVRVEFLMNYSWYRKTNRDYLDEAKATRLVGRGVCSAIPLQGKEQE